MRLAYWAGLFCFTLACLAGVVFLCILPSQGQQVAQAAAQATQNAQVQQALTATSLGCQPCDPHRSAHGYARAGGGHFHAEIPAVDTSTLEPAITSTVAAALTQAALAQLTSVPTSTALPKTGIGDEFGAPGLVIMGMVLVAVIFLARRLRAVPTK